MKNETTTKEVSPALKIRAQQAARNAYNTDSYGNGRHDWQSAEVAACAVLQEAGFTNDEAYELGGDIAGDVVTEIDDKEAID